MLLGLWTVLAQATHPEGAFTRGGLPHGDGLYHYAQVRSLVLDGDLRLANDYARLGNPHHQPVREDGWAGNHFTIGTALVWVPAFVLTHAVVVTGDAVGLWQDPGDGTSRRSQRGTMLGSAVAGWLGLVLIARTLRRWFGQRTVGLVVVLAAVATPWAWYVTRQPSWSHAASVLAVAGLCHATALGGPQRGAWRGAVVGVWLGLAVLIRPQDVAFAVWPVGGGLVALFDSERRTRAGWGLAAMLAVVAVAWAPQAWVWSQTYGTAWTVPQGPDFLHWEAIEWDLVLWSSRGGLLAWSPAIGIALVGLGLAAWRGPWRWPARALAVSVVLEIVVAGAVDDWWGGWAFGGRRLLACLPAFALGWARVLAPVVERGRGGVSMGPRTSTVGRIAAMLLVLGATRLSVSMQDDYLRGRLQRGVPQPLAPAWSRAFGLPLEPLLERIGTPGSWPASWVFALRTGAAPGRYDASAGWALIRSRGDDKGWDRLWIDDPRWAVAGWGEVTMRGEHRAAAVRPGATLVIPLRTSMRVEGRLRAWAARPGPLRLTLPDGERVTLELRTGWHDYAITPSVPLTAGLNVLRCATGPIQSVGQSGGESGSEVDVAIAWLDVFEPGRDPMAERAR